HGLLVALELRTQGRVPFQVLDEIVTRQSRIELFEPHRTPSGREFPPNGADTAAEIGADRVTEGMPGPLADRAHHDDPGEQLARAARARRLHLLDGEFLQHALVIGPDAEIDKPAVERLVDEEIASPAGLVAQSS